MLEKINNKGEAFDWAWALWYWFSHNYGGMGCDKYAALCKLTSKYGLSNIPTIDMEEFIDDEYEMARMYYGMLEGYPESWEEQFDEFCRFMDDEWDSEETA